MQDQSAGIVGKNGQFAWECLELKKESHPTSLITCIFLFQVWVAFHTFHYGTANSWAIKRVTLERGGCPDI